MSLAKAAELSGQSLMEFMGTLKFLGISSIVYTEEMLQDDVAFDDLVKSYLECCVFYPKSPNFTTPASGFCIVFERIRSKCRNALYSSKRAFPPLL